MSNIVEEKQSSFMQNEQGDGEVLEPKEEKMEIDKAISENGNDGQLELKEDNMERVSDYEPQAEYSNVGQSEQVKEMMTNIMYIEQPRDDDLLYCEDCKKEHEGDCPVHGPLIVVQNMKVEENDPDRALHSLPTNLLVKESNIDGAGLGVFTDTEIPVGITYGPYEGMYIRDLELANFSGYCWKIYKDNEQPSYFVDAGDKAFSNWMRYVNCALSISDQNLVALQYKGEIYYRCIKPILPKTELLIWYGDDCARALGITRYENPMKNPDLINGDYTQMKKIQEGSPLQNDVYGKLFDKRFKLNRQIKTHHFEHIMKLSEEKLSKCEYCDMSFENRSRMKKHMRVHTEEKHYKCDVCDKVLSNISSLTVHRRIHTGERPYICDVCNKGFSDSSSFTSHKRIHTGEKPYKCDVCYKEYSSISNLTVHKRSHTGERPYICDVCYMGFSNSSTLSRHERIHTGEKPYNCDVCNKGFSSSYALTRHKRTHTGERPYKCDVCNKSYSERTKLNIHIKKHTGEKPYNCDVCNKVFYEISKFTRHKRTHTGEKPYQCDVCGMVFSEKSKLTRHKRIHIMVRTVLKRP